MRAAPQKESRLEREEELGEVREVIRREEWVRRGWTTPPPPGKDFCEDARSLAISSQSRSNKAKTDVEMRSPKGRAERRGGRQTDGGTDDEIDPDSN